jgi:diguanylate cyclase (GGDEF)-like protein
VRSSHLAADISKRDADVPLAVANPNLPVVSHLRGLLEVSRLVRAKVELPELLDAVSRCVSEALGFRTVVINLYRPAWDDFEVATVHGDEGARLQLLGAATASTAWGPLLDERFCLRGAYVIRAGDFDWSGTQRWVPDRAPLAADDAWHPEDALFVPMRHSGGHLLGILSVDEPLSGLRPSDEELDVLVAVAEHAAQAVQAAQEAAEAARHRLALEQLLAISSRLTVEPVVDEMLRAVCAAIRDALGFQNVLAALRAPGGDRLNPRAAVGWKLRELDRGGPMYLSRFEPLLVREFEREGCYLLPAIEAERRVPQEEEVRYRSALNGSGPWAWNHHWLVVPLRDPDHEPLGLLFVDEPADRLIPSSEKLQALRVFANQAAAALVASAHREQLRFLAEHDPLTRLLNRRAFVARLDAEVARASRYGRTFGLVLCDLDGFKAVNDRFGHAAGDAALQGFAGILHTALRRPDDAYRIGGDEFALMLAEASEEDARGAVERIAALLEASDDPQLARVSASFGAASYPGDAPDAASLFRRADEALYEAKRGGSGLAFVA